MKKLAIAIVLAAMSATVMAQNFEGKTIEERIAYSTGDNEDSIKTAKGYITMFQQAGANKDYADMYIDYEWLKKYAPFSVNGIYTQGPFMFYNLINSEQDKAKKKKYFDEMMELFELRQKNLDALNSFANTKSTLGDVLSVKAEYYNWTAPNVEGSEYTLNKAYANFAEAIKMVNEQGGREITGTFLQTFFLVSDAMYKAAPGAMREQYLQDYLDSKDACEKMLQLAKEAQANGDEAKAEKLVATYDAPLAAIEQIFSQSGAADSTQLTSTSSTPASPSCSRTIATTRTSTTSTPKPPTPWSPHSPAPSVWHRSRKETDSSTRCSSTTTRHLSSHRATHAAAPSA